MIVHIDSEFLNHESMDANIDNAFFICRVMEHGHYIDAARDVITNLESLIEQYSTPAMDELFKANIEMLSPTDDMKEWLTTINLADYDKLQRRVLLFKPAELLVENAPNEWNVYKRIIEAYANDRRFKKYIAIMKQKIAGFNLVPENAGGAGNIISVFDLKNSGEYYHLYKMKCCVVFDRDTDDETHYDSNKNRLFERFCDGKNNTTVTDDDIYRVPGEGDYMWHMWYKRAIENYFPANQYTDLGVDVTEALVTDYSYYHFEDGKNGYDKTMMARIGTGMSCSDFEDNTKKFQVDGFPMSEMLILLHKIAKII